jgi:hypothetical protein
LTRRRNAMATQKSEIPFACGRALGFWVLGGLGRFSNFTDFSFFGQNKSN